MGAIRDKWQAEGFEFGALGFPKSGIIDDEGEKYQEYDGGKIVYTNTGDIRVVLY